MTEDTMTEAESLRAALIRCGRAAGALLSDDVSTEFLMLIPAEVEARIAHAQPTVPGFVMVDERPDIGAPTREPSLRHMVRLYYGEHFGGAEADDLTEQYFAALSASPSPSVTGEG